MKDFRSIACCNTIYKCITKILANRVEGVLPDLVSMNQSAFIKGRRISNNILLAHEFMRNYHPKGVSSLCAIKIDLVKAFDSIDRRFLDCLLRAISFPDKIVRWIKACISTPWYSVAVNGSLAGYFKEGKGLRQGDPLSPYLFILAMEIFTQMPDSAASEGKLGFHPKCQGLFLTHLCFADDLMVFTDGELSSIRTLIYVLQSFYEISG
ncbi:hypothetical protein CDL15_Pgr022810 [Punica granatum]|nr:hypothetical protein CDL15_Pgr022810 [Punica granatum]